MSEPFLKHYPDTRARQRAEANYRWLARLHGPAGMPELLAATGLDLRFEHIDGRHALPHDLTMLAAHLGDMHGAAYSAELHQANLGHAHQAPGGHQLPAFPDRRINAVARELNAGNVPASTLTVASAQRR